MAAHPRGNRSRMHRFAHYGSRRRRVLHYPLKHVVVSATATVGDWHDSAIDGDDEEYGEVIQRPSKIHLQGLLIESKPRGPSLGSSNSSLSPIVSPDIGDPNTVSSGTGFPFSISRSPPADL